MKHIKKYLQIEESVNNELGVDGILNTIDISKMNTKWVYIGDMCEKEFQIYDYTNQPEDNLRLTYCYYHRWICTDTEVGIRVWYLDNDPVCISWKPYRKSDETFGWISKEKFSKVRDYIFSLKDEGINHIDIIDDETINKVITNFDQIDYKKSEVKNLKP